MKLFAYSALLGLASCYDAETDYDVVHDSETHNVILNPKGEHTETLLYLHGGNGSAEGDYYGSLRYN